MIRSISIALFLVLLFCAAGAAPAQEPRTKTVVVSPDEASILPGIGAIIRIKDSALVVEMIPGPDNRDEKFKSVDLKKGDVVLMCNGKRVETCAELNDLVGDVQVGDKVKLGIRRNGAMMITSFEKVESSGQPVMMTTTMGAPGPATGNKKVVQIGDPGAPDGTVLVLDGGLIIGHGDNGPMPVVVALMPDAADKIEGDMPRVGDEIVSINGNIDTNIAAFEEWYSSLPEGEDIKIFFKRGDEDMTCTYTKSKLPSGSMMIKK